ALNGATSRQGPTVIVTSSNGEAILDPHSLTVNGKVVENPQSLPQLDVRADGENTWVVSDPATGYELLRATAADGVRVSRADPVPGGWEIDGSMEFAATDPFTGEIHMATFAFEQVFIPEQVQLPSEGPRLASAPGPSPGGTQQYKRTGAAV